MALLQSPHWPFLIDVYFFLGGLAGGAFVFATAALILNPRRYRDVVRAGYYLALAALIPCPLILIVDLGVPSRFLNMITRFNIDSPMSMGAWALLGFSVCAFVAALLTFLEDLGRARNFTLQKRMIGVVGSAFGFFLAAYPGVLLGATARPLWIESDALGALFLAVGASSAAAAIALILLLMGRRTAEQVPSVRTMTVVALVIQLVTLVVFVTSVQGSGSEASTAALKLLTEGRFAALFWGGAITIGSVLPLVLGLVDLRRRTFGLTALTSLLVLVGGFLVKYVIMAAGQV
jgi:formate-dependent nitrite reductase membrane component NrfD